MCKECEEHRHFVCECSREFDKIRQMTGHQSNCKMHQKLLEEEREKRRLPNGLFKCENPGCPNEHDGSYGSGRFCSLKCRRHYSVIASAKTAIERGHKHSPKNFKAKPAKYGTWKCDVCGEILETRRKKYDHMKNFHPAHPRGRSWNKGLTKETSTIIANSSVAIKERMARAIKNELKIGRGKTPEREALRRKHLSEAMKNNPRAGGVRPGSGIGKHGWYRGYWCDSSWELAMVIFWLEHNIEFHRCKETFDYVLDGKHHTYHPDFQLASGEIVEVKGRETTKEWKAKLSQFPEDRKIVVIGKSQIVPYIDYAVSKYGKNYIDLYEKQNFNGEIP